MSPNPDDKGEYRHDLINEPLRTSSLERKQMGNESTTRYHVQRREFLNENPTSGEFIIAIVQDTREIPDEGEQSWRGASIQLELCDGWDSVGFLFDMNTSEDRANTLRKINLIAEVINEVREAIQLEVESRDACPHVSYLSDTAVA